MTGFRTGRLRCRPLAEGGLKLYVAIYSDAAMMVHVGPQLAHDAAVRSFAAAVRANREQPQHDYYWVIEDRASGAALGLLALRRRGAAPGEAEIGAMVLPGQQSRGYAAEAILALVDRAFAMPDIRAVFTRHRADHAAAHGLMRKLGFDARISADGRQIRWRLTRAGRMRTLAQGRADSS